MTVYSNCPIPPDFKVESNDPPWPNDWHAPGVRWEIFELLAVGDLGDGNLVVVSGGVLSEGDGPNLLRCHWPGGAWFERRMSDDGWEPEHVKTGKLPDVGADTVREVWAWVTGAFARGHDEADAQGIG